MTFAPRFPLLMMLAMLLLRPPIGAWAPLPLLSDSTAPKTQAVALGADMP
jgi:hypothetical protein